MTVFIALLRAVNVGGTGKLAMKDLTAVCEAAGFAKVRTHIASGNVVFESNRSEARAKAVLEASLRPMPANLSACWCAVARKWPRS
jgi:uncharacterized protein (DUF1697 family)